jgi:hypothetical protein
MADDLGGFVIRVYECIEPDCPPGRRFVAHCTAPVTQPKPHMATMPATVYGASEPQVRDELSRFLAESIRKQRKRERQAHA